MNFAKHVFVLCSLFSVLQPILSCKFDVLDERAHCPSFQSLEEAGRHPEWKRLNVINPGKEPLSSIPKGTFRKLNNVKDLQVKGLADGIDPGAWTGLDKLFELHLDDNRINVIQSDAFADLPFELIYIFFCDVRELMPGAFNKLPNARRVDLYGNNIATIKEGVFTNTDISHVILHFNRIKTVEPNAFSDMENLIFLGLEDNELTSFSSQLIVGFATKLRNFYLNNNKLTRLSRDMFIVMPNLQVLIINNNEIETVSKDVFRDLRQIALLDISRNRIDELQTNAFNPGGMKNLQLLFIHENRLTFLATEVLDRLPRLEKITVGGNPWQCSCYYALDSYLVHNNITKLCNELYRNGQKPTCINVDHNRRNCIYDLESVKDIPRIFEEQIHDYLRLPSVCDVNEWKNRF